jgi:hypothetical protein
MSGQICRDHAFFGRLRRENGFFSRRENQARGGETDRESAGRELGSRHTRILT